VQRTASPIILLAALAASSACGDQDSAFGAGSADAAREREGFLEMTLVGEPGKPRVLVYTFENYWRHYSNLECRGAMIDLWSTRGWTIATTNDPLAITATNLENSDVLVFCVTSGSGLSAASKTELEAWVRAGGGIVGYHSATATEPQWPFYAEAIGTTFATHAPGVWSATVQLDSSTHPITQGLSDFELTDEWYVFTRRPETIDDAQMLLSIDETTLASDYPASYAQGYHPIGWASERFGGRMFYSAFGHELAAWHDPHVLAINARAIEWAARQR
jgi:uncharacterized protein